MQHRGIKDCSKSPARGTKRNAQKILTVVAQSLLLIAIFVENTNYA